MPVKNRLHQKHNRLQQTSLVRQSSFSSSQENADPRYSSTKDSRLVNLKRQLRHYHYNARRTMIHLILDRKMQENMTAPQKRKRRVSYFLMSQEYKRKMSHNSLQIPEQENTPRRKISWGEQSEFVTFNKNKSCQAIKQAPRHKFSIDQ